MIYFIDDDYRSLRSWIGELESRGREVTPYWNATEAYADLLAVEHSAVDLVLIDVMLAVLGDDQQFSSLRTQDFQQTGLRLAEDLCDANPEVFPHRGVFLTNATARSTRAALEATSRQQGLLVWKKADFITPVEFADQVEEHIAELDRKSPRGRQ